MYTCPADCGTFTNGDAPAEVMNILSGAHEHWSDADTKTFLGGDEDSFVVYNFSTKSITKQGRCSTDSNPPNGCESGTSTPPPTTGGMQKCFYPDATVNGAPTGYTVWCASDYVDCREGSESGKSISLTGLSLGAPSSCESGWPSTTTTCPSGQYWSGSSCTTSTTPTPTTTTTASGSCSSELMGLLGDGCHSMGNAWFDGPMTQYVMPNTTTVQSCATTWVSGCSGGSSTTTGNAQCSAGFHFEYNEGASVICFSDGNHDQYQIDQGATISCSSASKSGCPGDTSTTPSSTCPSGEYWDSYSQSCMSEEATCSQGGGTWDSASNWCNMPDSSSCGADMYWDGYSCVPNSSPSTTCTYGQYWDSTTNSCMSEEAGCAQSGGTWDTGNNYCDMSGTSSGGTTATSCGSGTYWDGYSCVSSSSTTSGSSCTGDQYWDGYSCVSNTTTSTSCGSGQYWDGYSCVTDTTPTPTTCSSDMYWDGYSCVPNTTTTTTTCSSDQYWDGSACVTSSSGGGGGTYTGDPQTDCATAGGTWSSADNFCIMPGASVPSHVALAGFCPTGHMWNGSYCTLTTQTTQVKFTASVFKAFLSLFGI
jgi:hypothetical protein